MSVSTINLDKVKILVVGDSGVGKSSLVHLICHNEVIQNPSWTIGCSVDVKLHEYKEGTPDERSMFVELWDIGGSNSYRNSRSIFYTPVHGLLLVHDLTNRKSQHNLRKWLGEVLSKSTNTPFSESQYPILVVGTKADLAQGALDASGRHRASSVAEDCLVDEMNIDCHNTKYVAPGSSNAVKISRFFDKVIEKQFYSHAPSAGATIGSFFDRRKPAPPQRPFSPPARTKLLHAD